MPRKIEAECWIPRVLAVGPVSVGTETVTLTSAPRPFGPTQVDGAIATVALVHADDASRNDELFDHAWRVSLSAVNRVVVLALHASGRPAVVAPPLGFRDVFDARVDELVGTGRRAVVVAEQPPQSVVIPPTRQLQQVVQQLARPSPKQADSEALWYDALEAACADRGREAVITARAAVEVAWADAAKAAIDEHLSSATPAASVTLRDVKKEALKPRTSIPDRLDTFSEVIFGRSFRLAWGNTKWSKVHEAFELRHRSAHQSGRIGIAEALAMLRLMREVLDDIAIERAKYP